jgi:Flp pilus assembly protein CpaB
VVVAVRALPAGAVIKASDLAVTRYPLDLAPESAIGDANALVGRSVAGPVGRAEALTPGRLVDAALLADLPPGTIALPVTATAESMALVRPGLRVDGFLPGRPGPVLRDALVLAATPGRASPLDGSTPAARVLLAVEAGQASALFGGLDLSAPMSEVTFAVR